MTMDERCMSVPVRSDYDMESKKHGEELVRTGILRKNGWLDGFAWFGNQTSEHSVKLSAAVSLLTKQETFPFKHAEHVDMKFDEGGIVNRSKKKTFVGVWSSDWTILTYGACTMPAICVNGVVHMDAGRILKAFAEAYPDPRLSETDVANVTNWVVFNMEHGPRVMEAAKHWGWSIKHGGRTHYKRYGKDKRDLTWEQAAVRHVHGFMSTLDAHFEAKGENEKAFYVGDKMTLADCAMLNWPWTLACVTGLDVKRRYPYLWAHALALKELKPEGTASFYKHFPAMGKAVGRAALLQRGLCSRGFHIEHPRYWGTDLKFPLLALEPYAVEQQLDCESALISSASPIPTFRGQSLMLPAALPVKLPPGATLGPPPSDPPPPVFEMPPLEDAFRSVLPGSGPWRGDLRPLRTVSGRQHSMRFTT